VIGAIRGRVESLTDKETMVEVLVDTGGIFYRVLVPTRDGADLRVKDSEVLLHTHLHVRDDALVLFGFKSPKDRDVFEALIQAPGVGPRLALSALSVYSAEQIERAVTADDPGAFAAVPGIGAKLARRIVSELRDRFSRSSSVTDSPSGALAEARAALAELGYSANEITEVLSELDPNLDTAEAIKAALRILGSAGK
jgi:Holliday junction DNA helicase RuvA